jgi:hypothetical protein
MVNEDSISSIGKNGVLNSGVKVSVQSSYNKNNFFFFCSTTTWGGFWSSLQAYSNPFYYKNNISVEKYSVSHSDNSNSFKYSEKSFPKQ